jgi:hypothetical protein
MTDRKMMGLHAEILALRDTLGISYKDACHRLYMTECEKLKKDERMQKTFLNLRRQAGGALGAFQKRLVQLGGQEVQSSINADADAAPSDIPKGE